MNEAIQQTVLFEEITAAELFDIYTDPDKHSALHGGAKTSITKHEGKTFSLLNGNLTGKNLMVVPGRMIVQAWRGNVWHKDDLDSILTLIFSDTKEGAKIEMIHAATPDQFPDKWGEIYWNPLRDYLAKNK